MSVTVCVPKNLRLGYEPTLKLLKRVGVGMGSGGGGGGWPGLLCSVQELNKKIFKRFFSNRKAVYDYYYGPSFFFLALGCYKKLIFKIFQHPLKSQLNCLLLTTVNISIVLLLGLCR